MKKALLTIAMVALMAAPATSAPLFSLWADAGQANCQVAAAMYAPFNLYVFLEPDAEGAFAAAYKLVAPTGHFSIANVKNSFVSPATIGEWIGAPGISVPFTSCQTTPVWIINLTMMSPNTTAALYTLEASDTDGFIGVAVCPDPRPISYGNVYNHFGFGTDCVIGTEDSSWGAIKNLF